MSYNYPEYPAMVFNIIFLFIEDKQKCSVKKVLEFHSVAYEIQPMFTRSSISFCLLSRLITLGKVDKSNGGPCTYKVFGLEMCKEIL